MKFIKKTLTTYTVLLIYKNISKFNYQQLIICLNNIIKAHFLKYLFKQSHFFYEIHCYIFALTELRL